MPLRSLMLRPALQPCTRRHRDILAALAVALFLRLAFALVVSDTYDYDEFVILQLARDFSHGSVPYRDFMFFHPPGALYIFRVLQPATDLWWPLGRVFTLLLDTATAALVWLAAS